MALGWETVRVREQAAALVARRTHRGLGPRLLEAPSRGEALLAWPPERGGGDQLGLGERIEARYPPPVEGPVPDLRAALDRCQRPFQLWDVPREVREVAFALEEQPAVGGAARQAWRPELPAARAELRAAGAAWEEARRGMRVPWKRGAAGG